MITYLCIALITAAGIATTYDDDNVSIEDTWQVVIVAALWPLAFACVAGSLIRRAVNAVVPS